MKKTSFMKSDSKLSKWKEFLNKKGFYVVLFICIFIIAGTGIYVTRMNMEYYSQDTIIGEPSTIGDTTADELLQTAETSITADPNLDNPAQPTMKEQDEDIQVPQEKEESKEKQELKVEAPEENPIIVKPPVKKDEILQMKKPQAPAKPQTPKKIDKLLSPVEGEVILAFAIDKLVYSKTLEQWSTHKGIDIKSDRGTPVKAAADGTIEKIYHDDKLGITIIIDHGNNLKTKYCNLSTDDMVIEKQQVKRGDIISGVGNTAIFEIGDEPHLHFEVIKDGKNIDPATLLPR